MLAFVLSSLPSGIDTIDRRLLLSIFIGSVYLIYRLFFFVFLPRPIPGVPRTQNGASSLLGDIPELAEHVKRTGVFSSYMVRKAEELGPLCCLFLGPRYLGLTMLVLTDINAIEDITAKRTNEFKRSQLTIDIFKGTIPLGQISLPTNTMWKSHRRALGPSMTSAFLSRSTHRISRSAKELVDLWRDKQAIIGPDAAFDTREDHGLSLTDFIFDFVFGASFGSVAAYRKHLASLSSAPSKNERGGHVDFGFVKDQKTRDSATVFSGFAECASGAFPGLWHTLAIRTRPSWRRAHRNVFTWMEDLRQKAERSDIVTNYAPGDERADNVLDLVLQQQKSATTASKLSNGEIRDELYTYVAAGSETSATTLSWAVKLLARHPEVQRKLRQHLLAALPDAVIGSLTYEDVQSDKTPYLDAVVHEMLRCSITAGGSTREATCDTTLLGHFVPKGASPWHLATAIVDDRTGTTVFMNFGGVAFADADKLPQAPEGATPSGWRDPSRFYPERWLREDDGTFDLKAGPSLPFSAGQRGCFGKSMALLSLKVYIATYALAFFFEAIPKELDGDEAEEMITRKPRQSFVRVRAWDQ